MSGRPGETTGRIKRELATAAQERAVHLIDGEANVELAHQLALAEKENHELHGTVAAALKTAARYKAEAESHAADNRMLRERVARQRSTIESLRRQQVLPTPVRVLVSAARRWPR